MKYLTLITVLLITFATQSMSGETVMVCDALSNEDKYYKLVNPLIGISIVKHRKKGQWKDFCNKDCVNLEVYETGAMQESNFFHSWDKNYPEQEIIKNVKYYVEIKYWLDFEFGKRTIDLKVYTNKSKTRELMKHSERQNNKEYSCEIQ